MANIDSSAGMFADGWRRKQEKHTSAQSVAFPVIRVLCWFSRVEAWSAAVTPNITIQRLALKSTNVMQEPFDPSSVKTGNLPRSVLGRTRDPSV